MIYFLKCVLYLYHDVNSQEVSMYALHLTENIWKKKTKLAMQRLLLKTTSWMIRYVLLDL